MDKPLNDLTISSSEDSIKLEKIRKLEEKIEELETLNDLVDAKVKQMIALSHLTQRIHNSSDSIVKQLQTIESQLNSNKSQIKNFDFEAINQRIKELEIAFFGLNNQSLFEDIDVLNDIKTKQQLIQMEIEFQRKLSELEKNFIAKYEENKELKRKINQIKSKPKSSEEEIIVSNDYNIDFNTDCVEEVIIDSSEEISIKIDLNDRKPEPDFDFSDFYANELIVKSIDCDLMRKLIDCNICDFKCETIRGIH
jgi:hypothetical protein